MLRRFAFATAVLCVLGLGMLAGPALAGTVIGTTSGTPVACSGPFTAFEARLATSGASYTIPAGSWVITSWSTLAGPDGGQMAMVVGRPTGTADQYTIVAEGSVETLTANALNTFPVSIGVQGGDVIGYYIPGFEDCAFRTGNGGDSLDLGSGEPAVGSVFATPDPFPGYILDLSVTLGPGGAAVPQVNNVFLCYSKFEQDGGSVFDVNEQAALIMQGYWLPSAETDNVAGGDNIGAYHLVCNPPTGLAATSLSLDDGGDVVPNAIAADGTGYYPILG
jgi:hypothetical protein